MKVGGSSFVVDAKKTINEIANMREDYTFLPMLYNSLVSRKLLDELIERTGRIFADPNPDVYSGFAFAMLVDEYPSIGKPMTINGSSLKSNGVQHSIPGNQSNELKETYDLLRKDGFTANFDNRHNMVQSIQSSFSTAKLFLMPNADFPSLGSERSQPTHPFDGQHIDIDITGKGDNIYEASLIAERYFNYPVSLDFKRIG
jgi:hypothetical protein